MTYTCELLFKGAKDLELIAAHMVDEPDDVPGLTFFTV